MAALDSKAVDVLAVMDAIQRRLDSSFGSHSFPELTEARAAVAELIEAARDLQRGGSDEKRSRLRAALARCTGEGA